MALIDKIKKNSTIDQTAILSQSKLTEKDMVQTPVPMLNVALSGRLRGGLGSGVTMIAGPSKNFKSMFALLMVKSYLDKFPDAAVLFYDSEFGTPKGYWKMMDIDEEKILHTPLTDVEVLKVDIMNQLKEIKRGDKLIIVLDSVGNLASKKEVDDALEGKSVADMTRAKALKSLFRMVTPHLNLKDIPMVVVNHTYKEIGMYPKDIVGGGTGSYYSADTIFIVSRAQEKDKDKELIGYNFTFNVEKSRYVKEKSKIPIQVFFNGGINVWSGLLDLAEEFGYVTKPKPGRFQRVGDKNEYKEEETNTEEFWAPLLKDKKFIEDIENKYLLV